LFIICLTTGLWNILFASLGLLVSDVLSLLVISGRFLFIQRAVEILLHHCLALSFCLFVRFFLLGHFCSSSQLFGADRRQTANEKIGTDIAIFSSFG